MKRTTWSMLASESARTTLAMRPTLTRAKHLIDSMVDILDFVSPQSGKKHFSWGFLGQEHPYIVMPFHIASLEVVACLFSGCACKSKTSEDLSEDTEYHHMQGTIHVLKATKSYLKVGSRRTFLANATSSWQKAIIRASCRCHLLV